MFSQTPPRSHPPSAVYPQPETDFVHIFSLCKSLFSFLPFLEGRKVGAQSCGCLGPVFNRKMGRILVPGVDMQTKRGAYLPLKPKPTPIPGPYALHQSRTRSFLRSLQALPPLLLSTLDHLGKERALSPLRPPLPVLLTCPCGSGHSYELLSPLGLQFHPPYFILLYLKWWFIVPSLKITPNQALPNIATP